MNPHFVSASCEGEVCYCGKPASHKLGEEIPEDEPCPECKLIMSMTCENMYHLFIGTTRHNLTSYVCCACFTRAFGRGMTRCSLTMLEHRAQMNYEVIHHQRTPATEPLPILCPRCSGGLIVSQPDPMTNWVLVNCCSCKMRYQLAFSAS